MRLTLSDYLRTHITEALQDYQKDKAVENSDYQYSQLSDDTIAKIHDALPNGHTMIDLHDHIEPDIDVHEHLANHGWRIKDYKTGHATKITQVGDPTRGIPHTSKLITKNIGKVLDETDAPDHVKHAYQNDPARTLKSANSTRILISTHPYAVHGKSTGTPWKSCMNMDVGANRDYLEKDMEHGTHEAYLVHHDDPTAESEGHPTNPLARISLKRMDTESEGHTIFRPDHISYGAVGSSMRQAVSNWAEKHYPAKSGEEYKLHSDLYDGGNHSMRYLNDEDVKKLGKGESENSDKVTLNDKHQSMMMKHFHQLEPGIKKNKTAGDISQSVDNLSSVHANTLAKHFNNESRSMSFPASDRDLEAGRGESQLIRYHGQNLSTSNLSDYLKERGSVDNLPISVLKNRRLPSHAVDQLHPNDYEHIDQKLIKPHHIDKAITNYENGESGSAYPINALTQKFNSDHITRIINHTLSFYKDIPNGIYKNKNFNAEHANQILTRSKTTKDIYPILRDTAHFGPEHVTTDERAKEVLSNPNAPKEATDKAADMYVRSTMINRLHFPAGSNKHFTDHHVKEMVDYHIDHDNTYGVSNIHDENLSNRVLHEFDKRIKDANEVYDKTDVDSEHHDELYSKLERLHTAHNEAAENHFSNHFSDMEEDDLQHNDKYREFASKIHDHHYGNNVNFSYARNLRDI